MNCHQTNLLWRLIQRLLVRSFSFKWMKFLRQPRKFIKELYLLSTLEAKSGLPHERVKHRGLLRVSMSCRFVSESQRGWIAQTFPLIHVLSRGSKPSSWVLSLGDNIILSFRKLAAFLMQRYLYLTSAIISAYSNKQQQQQQNNLQRNKWGCVFQDSQIITFPVHSSPPLGSP